MGKTAMDELSRKPCPEEGAPPPVPLPAGVLREGALTPPEKLTGRRYVHLLVFWPTRYQGQRIGGFTIPNGRNTVEGAVDLRRG